MAWVFGEDNRSNEEKITSYLNENKDTGFCDDCLSYELKIKPRQTMNKICRILKSNKKIERIESLCPLCNKLKILNFLERD